MSCCLRDLGCHTQSEGSKGPYLYFAIHALGDTDYFMNPVIVKFLSARHRDRLAQQLIDLLLWFARDGHPAAIGALHAKYAQFAAKRRLRSGRTHARCHLLLGSRQDGR